MQSKTKELDPILEVNNLFASIENLPILKGVTISVNPGEIHAIMGRNGCGKSTLSKIIAGHPSYKITKGEIKFTGNDIHSLEPEERAQSGIFLGFQYPIEIPGVSNLEFLRVATNARRKFLNKEELDTFDSLFLFEWSKKLENLDLFESLQYSLLIFGNGFNFNLSRQIFCISDGLLINSFFFISSIICIDLLLFYKIISPFISFFLKL